MAIPEALQAHLSGGSTTLARAWAITRRDGVELGFTDHDRDLSFDGVEFRAETGMSARALSQTTGLSVDNSAAVGALSSEAITEADIAAGRYDRAELWIWLVNWTDVTQRVALFSGSLGEITCGRGGFEVEIRGQAEALNQPQGRVYQRPCSAVLGDAACGFDTSLPGYSVNVTANTIESRRIFRFEGVSGFQPRWFEHGRLEILGGAASGLVGAIKTDREEGGARLIELWSEIRGPVAPGDALRLIAGCDRTADTCRWKFNNFIGFRGFPHIPGEDWLMSYPSKSGVNDGGSLNR
ncbi:DUF2163 domain-containing protein [Rhodovulum euryhalinum]|uniref:Putative phage protein (TIGR02218 family) n=1 Tax=Rhodovulum euryhalinum TaxID=35805 RepID=A0A4R2KFB1_9RHOB|nr:DUF2163 domain-containing protein [Rhodovulum euryhalinum]TCO70907.1 putative phage protein (TIGR02218 family) [Rhodovulum euryhalinum]